MFKHFEKNHKKVLIILGGILLALLLAVLIISALANRKLQQEEEYLPSLDELIDQDSDFDGIPDWEEVLLGFNPLQGDTDLDGLSDGTTLGLVRSLAASDENQTSSTEQLAYDQLSLTDKVGRRVFTTVSLLETSGLLTQEEEQVIQDQVRKDLLYGEGYNIITDADLKLLRYSDLVSRLSYMEETTKILGELSFTDPNPLEMLDAAIERDDPRIVEEGLINNTASIRDSRLLLMAIPVDPIYFNDHLAIVNYMLRLEQDILDMQQFFSDPLLGYGASIKYRSNGVSLMDQVDILTEKILGEIENL